MPPNHRQVCMHEQFNMQQLIMSYYKIMGSRIGNHFRVQRTLAPRGSGLGLRVRRENGSTRSVSDNGSLSCRIREEGLGWRPGHIGSTLVGADLVVTKVLLGRR